MLPGLCCQGNRYNFLHLHSAPPSFPASPPLSSTDRSHVDGGRRLVHDEDAALPHEGSGQTEELPLALAEVLAALRHDGVCRQSVVVILWLFTSTQIFLQVETDLLRIKS